MLATPVRMARMPGFFRRSMDEFKRQAVFAIRMEGLYVPNKPFPLMHFATPDSVDRCKLMSDQHIGGYSQASLTFVEGNQSWKDKVRRMEKANVGDRVIEEELLEGEVPNHALFKGSINIELPPRRPDIQRSGFAGWRTQDRGFSLFGKLLWDLDAYNNIALRVKSDGRKYFVNIQTESLVPTDLHQHLLPPVRPGVWETVHIPITEFVRTNFGMVVEPQKEMMTQKVRTIGIASTDRVQGPFELAIAGVWATNMEPKREIVRDERGFEVHPERIGGLLGEIEPSHKRKKGEPERILI